MNFEDIMHIINICPNCGSNKGIPHMHYIGYRSIETYLRVYFACNKCLNHFEYTLQGPVRVKDKPI